ncbi:MAG: PAS domain S-box protein [Deltaproteobacteria bacterium]|nr:PAS domain S-box protein [Deltaproteobacteria bacterium]
MSDESKEKNSGIDLNGERSEDFFELVPCMITVQDKAYKLLRYNQEFAERFDPKPGDYCFHAYKDREEKCTVCPVERTFEDGRSHWSEETGFNKDGSKTHWMVRTAPIRNTRGEIVAAIEMSLDITEKKQLEEKLSISEQKYHAIFNNIPNPIFVLSERALEILDCNENVKSVYGYSKAEMIGRSFLDFFREAEKEQYDAEIRENSIINRIGQITKEGKKLFVNMQVSSAEYSDQKAFLVTITDMTKSLETEQQLIQASKMATLGEMATGVAHELNQPLSVIKTASSFFIRKLERHEDIDEDILLTMSRQMDSYVDRASKIINHMREFGRKTDLSQERIRLNEVTSRAGEIFIQQFKLRGIELVWDLEENLPDIMGDPGRLEQVFINLLLNARDAVEDRWEINGKRELPKRIEVQTHSDNGQVICKISDTGLGVPENFKEKIFEPFFTTKKPGRGTGLGLSISYGIVQECGGAIEVENNETGGACIVISFPAMDI